MPVSPWIIFFIAIGLVALIFTFRISRAVKLFFRSGRFIRRREYLRGWAHSKGLNFNDAPDGGLADRFSNFKCLQRGRQHYAFNRMEGDWGGFPIEAFDYYYSVGVDEHRINREFSAVIITSPIPLKPLYIGREDFLDKLTELAGFGDIDFESAEFNRKFRVQSPDRQWACDIIHPRMMEHLLAGPDVAIQFDFMHIFVWSSRLFAPGDFEAAAKLAHGILDRLPEYVIKQRIQGP